MSCRCEGEEYYHRLNSAKRLMTFVAWHEAGLMKFPDNNRNIRLVRWFVEAHPHYNLDLTGFPQEVAKQ